MQHQEIVPQHLKGQFCADACQLMARKPTQTAMFLEVGKHQLDRLPPQPVDRFGARGRHPGRMRKDDLFVFATPNTPTDFAACRALRPERARLARGGFHPIAYHDFLTSPTTSTRFASYALEHLPRGTPLGLQLGQPLEWRLGEQGGGLGPTHVVRFPGAVEGDLCLRTQG